MYCLTITVSIINTFHITTVLYNFMMLRRDQCMNSL